MEQHSFFSVVNSLRQEGDNYEEEEREEKEETKGGKENKKKWKTGTFVDVLIRKKKWMQINKSDEYLTNGLLDHLSCANDQFKYFLSFRLAQCVDHCIRTNTAFGDIECITNAIGKQVLDDTKTNWQVVTETKCMPKKDLLTVFRDDIVKTVLKSTLDYERTEIMKQVKSKTFFRGTLNTFAQEMPKLVVANMLMDYNCDYVETDEAESR